MTATLRHNRPGVAVLAGSPDETVDVERLFRASEERLGRFLAQMVRNRALAEDLLQDTFVVAMRSREELARADNAEAWLFGVARNRALAALRRQRRGIAAVGRLWERRRDEPDPAAAIAVRDVLAAALDPDDRTLVVLRYVHGFSAPELATITGRSADAVRQRLARACARLSAAIDPPDNETGGSR